MLVFTVCGIVLFRSMFLVLLKRSVLGTPLVDVFSALGGRELWYPEWFNIGAA